MDWVGGGFNLLKYTGCCHLVNWLIHRTLATYGSRNGRYAKQGAASITGLGTHRINYFHRCCLPCSWVSMSICSCLLCFFFPVIRCLAGGSLFLTWGHLFCFLCHYPRCWRWYWWFWVQLRFYWCGVN
jgi:hypothetical protein